jgi:hypothetical protein
VRPPPLIALTAIGSRVYSGFLGPAYDRAPGRWCAAPGDIPDRFLCGRRGGPPTPPRVGRGTNGSHRRWEHRVGGQNATPDGVTAPVEGHLVTSRTVSLQHLSRRAADFRATALRVTSILLTCSAVGFGSIPACALGSRSPSSFKGTPLTTQARPDSPAQTRCDPTAADAEDPEGLPL